MTAPSLCRVPFPEALADELRSVFGDRAAFALAVLQQHGSSEGHYAELLPDAVLFPETTDEVRTIIRACRSHKIPVIPYGAGTCIEGQVTPISGGVTIDLSRMDSVLAVNADDMDCVVQPGVRRASWAKKPSISYASSNPP
jgi:D-lactate dehydrogenase (cytochrome)